MKMKRTSKPYNEYLFIVDDTQGLQVTGHHSETDLAAKKMGVLASQGGTGFDPDEFIAAGTLPTAVPAVRVVQGLTGTLEGNYGWSNVADPSFQMSPEIRKCEVQSISSGLTVPSRSAVLFKDFCDPACDDGDYTVYVTQESQRIRNEYGRNDKIAPVSVATRACDDTCATAPVDELDALLQRVIYQLNLHSNALTYHVNGTIIGGNNDFIALAISSAGLTGTVINTIALGDTISVATLSNGETLEVTADASMIQALADAVDAGSIAGTESIIEVDLSTAGAAATVDQMMFISLNEHPAVGYSGIYRDDVRLRVELGGGFDKSINKVTKVDLAGNSADRMSGSNLLKMYELRAFAQDGGTELAGFSDTLIKRTPKLDPDAYYKLWIVDTASMDSNMQSNARTIFAKKVTITGTTNVANGVTYTVATETVPTLQEVLGVWLQGMGSCDTPIEFVGDATSTAALG